MPLDLRQIRYAHAIAAHRSFNRAAAALGIAQPTLSRSVKQLEGQLGVPLFTRSAQGVEPTDFGLMFLKEAASVADCVADLEQRVSLAKDLRTGDVALGVGPYAAEALVPGCLRRFSARHPEIHVCIQLDAPDALGRMLRARNVDLVVAEASYLVDDAFEVIARLPAIKGYVLVRARHPLLSRADASMADVLDYPFVQVARMPPRALTQLLQGRRRKPSAAGTGSFPSIECPTVAMALNAVLDSDATMLAALSMAQAELDRGLVRPLLHEPWMCSDWAIVKLRRRSLAPAAMAMVAELQRAHEQAVARDRALSRAWNRRIEIRRRGAPDPDRDVA
jgi:DNA-binding transcriptional LysR family regulator